MKNNTIFNWAVEELKQFNIDILVDGWYVVDKDLQSAKQLGKTQTLLYMCHKINQLARFKGVEGSLEYFDKVGEFNKLVVSENTNVVL